VFTGQDLHTFDEKGRLTLPAKYRDDLEKGVVVTRSVVEPCLLVFTRQQWEVVGQRCGDLNSLDDDARRVARYLFANAAELVPDRQGRVIVPERLRTWAGLDGEALILGSNIRLEIWSAERWAALNDELEANPDLLKASARQLGINIGI
jgi:MraZ protein